MNRLTPMLVLALTGAAFLAGAGAVWLLQRARADDTSATATTDRADTAATGESEKKVLYWYDPMVPQERFDRPGKSPFMDMQLVPKYAAEDDGAGLVAIDPQLVQNLGVRTAPARLGRIERRVRANGTIAFDEREVSTVSAPVAAIVQRLHVRAPLDVVRAGQPLLDLLAPEWTAAQQEYLGLRRARSAGLEPLVAAARQRLVLLGMSEGQVRALERRGSVSPRVTVVAPRDGVLGELSVREGASVLPGAPLVRINGLDTVWVNAAVAERDAAAVGPGAVVRASVAARPGQVFEGRVEAVLPSVDAATRTLTARVVLDNADRALVPGMFAQLEVAEGADARERVLVPSEAVIVTGTREVVLIAADAGRFRAQEVRVGAEAGGETEILEGLAAGDAVVLSGQFLIDSEASLTGALARLDGSSDAESPSPPADEPARADDPQ